MKIAIVVVLLMAATNVSWAGNIPPSDNQQGGMVEGRAIPHLNVRPLTAYEKSVIHRYMAEYGRRLSAENASALRQALETLVGTDQSHVPLTRKPADYLDSWQSMTQVLNRTTWKVRMPAPPAPAPPAPRKKRRPRSQPAPPAPVAINYQPGLYQYPVNSPPANGGGPATLVSTSEGNICFTGGSRGNITVSQIQGQIAQGNGSSSAATGGTSTSSNTNTGGGGGPNGGGAVGVGVDSSFAAATSGAGDNNASLNMGGAQPINP